MKRRKKSNLTDLTDELGFDLDFLDEETLSSGDQESGEQENAKKKQTSSASKKKLPAWVIIPILGVILLCTFGLYLLFGKQDTSSDTKTLSVAEVKRGNIREVYNSSGTIESENTKTYYSPVTAPITNLNATVGKTVKKGDLLVTFDTAGLERDTLQAQLNLQSSYNSSQAAREQNARAIDAANAASANLENQANILAEQANALKEKADAAKAEYDAQIASISTPEAQARAAELQTNIQELNTQIQNTQNLINTLSVIYEGSGEVYSEAVATPEEQRSDTQKQLIRDIDSYNTAVADLPNLQAQLAASEAELASLTTVADTGYEALYAQYEAAYAQYEAAVSSAEGSAPASGITSSEIANLDISDNLAELAALTPQELLEKAREGMKADMDGVIASVDILHSNSAAQGAAVFSIASTENVRVKIEVSPDDYAKMKTGNTADITVGDHKYKGTLASIDKIAINNAKGNPVIGAQIHIDNPDENLCIGATAKISMTVASSDDVLVVPTETINASSDGDFVFIIKDGIVQKKPVELGHASTTEVEVVSGLKEGDYVVNDLNVDLSEGMKAIGIPETDDQK